MLLGASLLVATVAAHSWMSCPLSFNPSVGRGGDLNGPCEVASEEGIPVTLVKRGDRVKIGWVSNNHGGGLVRLALLPMASDGTLPSHGEFDNSVIKMTCFGHDQRPGHFRFGDCIHPCDARPGCQWQESLADRERYDTTISIPLNLKDGPHIVQWKALVGEGAQPYYSCAKLMVQGGDLHYDGATNHSIPVPDCQVSLAGAHLDAILPKGWNAGQFVYRNDSIDADLSIRPINFQCDPRVSCLLAADVAKCSLDLDGIPDPNSPMRNDCPLQEGEKSNVIVTDLPEAPQPPPFDEPLATKTTASTTASTANGFSFSCSPPTTVTIASGTIIIKETVTSVVTFTNTPLTVTSPTASAHIPNVACTQSSDLFFCQDGKLARCVFGELILIDCAPGTVCKAGMCDWP